MKTTAKWLILALVAPAAARASAPELRIGVDPFGGDPRPMIPIRAFGRTQVVIVDTGASDHFLAARAYGAPSSTKETGVVGRDYAHRPIRAARVAADAELPGWARLGERGAVWLSDWADLEGGGGGRHLDGLLSPQRLAGPGQAVVMDFVHGTMALRPWDEAMAEARELPLPLADGEILADDDSKFVVDAVVGGAAVKLAIDTGASRSLLYQPRGDDLPAHLVRMRERHARLRAGRVEAPLDLALLEPIDDERAAFGGLIGMDVLRHCLLAFDRGRMVARCRAGDGIDEARGAPDVVGAADGVAWIPKQPVERRALVRAGGEGPWLRQTPTGEYRWCGHGACARIHRDGTVEIIDLPQRWTRPRWANDLARSLRFLEGHPLTEDPEALARLESAGWADDVQEKRADDRSEKQRFLDETLDFRVGLAKAYDRELIAQSLAWLPGHLARVWGDGRMTARERRRVLFAIWDEAAEPDDAERGWAGAKARGAIDRFIRTRLPAGSRDGYSAEELAQLNARRQRGLRFAPYSPTEPLDRVL